MPEPYMTEIRAFSFNHPPSGWAPCDGRLLSIRAYEALFSLLGTTYGGDGINTFGLPNMGGRVGMHAGSHPVGDQGGATSVTITAETMPVHTHLLSASLKAGNTPVPTNTVLAETPAQVYSPSLANLTPLNAATVSSVGGNQPHSNMQPYMALNFCIALQGVWPSPT